ncbi:ATP synthase F1 subunit delta [Rubrobacter taiwanensis]|uniref:ATP synthase subunit delta n=1 Tax=Rubrobacter taiwanensis TaxID=185139 RepID=A0A4R1BP49_9ACTN|nr:ATP synthase F1 subunit delta [Rubrobacter taiwanensis]TCJ19420.1 ATP synthase F1 subunit delta [Rubrobacter taiwanensis]
MSVVSTYAEALFEAAQERGNLEETLQDLKDFAGALRENEELRRFYYHAQVTKPQKRRVLDQLTEGMQQTARNFLKVLADKDREEYLEEILLRYEELVKDHLGRVEVELTTAVELPGETLRRIEERLKEILGRREVVLENRVDEDILGGAVFRFGGMMLDGSVRGQLEGLREKMLERGVV